jgi:1-acyl-sn-glycerol-3-phosphate acyltransferase
MAEAQRAVLLGHDASAWSRWRRRAWTLPMYSLACVLACTFAPFALTFTVVFDVVRSARWSSTRGVLAVTAYLMAECVGIALSFVLWIAHRPGTPGWDRAHVRLQRAWASALFTMLARLFALKVHVESDPAPDGPSVCLVRHASLADTLVPVALVAGRWDRSPRYALKRELLMDPCLDIVGQRLPNAFLSRKAAAAEDDARMIETLAKDLPDDGIVVVYPEGTLFSRAKLAARLEQLAPERRERLKGLLRVLPPRPRGAFAAISARPDAAVIVVAHAGLERIRSLRDLFDGSLIGSRFDVSIRRVVDVPIELDRFTAWLDHEWLRVDAWIAERA